MPTTLQFPLPEGLEITSISETPEALLVQVTSHRAITLWPLCSTPSSAVHNLCWLVLATWYICSEKATVKAIERAFTGCKKTCSQGKI